MPKKIPTARPQFKFKQAESKDRQADKAFYNSASWKKVRSAHLKKNPICSRCKAEGYVNGDRLQVHHKTDRKLCSDPYALENLETLCINCHSKITAKNNHLNNRY